MSRLKVPALSEELSVWRGVAVFMTLAGVGLAIYANGFDSAFIFDDDTLILSHPAIRTLWPPWSPMLDTNRPIGFFSFAVNYALHGTEVWGYHVANLAIHVAAAWVLFGIVRRTLLHSPRLADHYGPSAWGLALAVALIWMAHPLQTQSVTYTYQRLESLMGLFYLLTLYLFIRGVHSARPAGWYAASVTCCALGMGTKEVMVTAPLMVLWYDRALVATSWREIFNRRSWFYAALAGTWSILAGLMASQWSKYPGGGVLVVKDITPISYGLSQPGVILRYLRLSLWPSDLCLDYAWPLAQSADEIVPPMVVIGALAAATLWSMMRRPALGFVGGWFFVVLAPTSSFAPIADLAFEHRMYLSLATVVLLVVIAGYEAWQRLAPPLRPFLLRAVPVAAVTAVVAALGYRTVLRNEDYETPYSIWHDTVQKQPDNFRALNNLGLAYRGDSQLDAAVDLYTKALKLRPRYREAYNNRGNALRQLGRNEEAIRDYRRAIALNPDYANAHYNLGSLLEKQGNFADAKTHFERAVAANPDFATAHYKLGISLQREGDLRGAILHYRQAVEAKPPDLGAANNLAWILATSDDEAIRDGTEAVRWALLCAAKSDYKQPAILDTLAAAYAEAGDFHHAVEMQKKTIEMVPPDAANMFRPRLELYQSRRAYRDRPEPIKP